MKIKVHDPQPSWLKKMHSFSNNFLHVYLFRAVGAFFFSVTRRLSLTLISLTCQHPPWPFLRSYPKDPWFSLVNADPLRRSNYYLFQRLKFDAADPREARTHVLPTKSSRLLFIRYTKPNCDLKLELNTTISTFSSFFNEGSYTCVHEFFLSMLCIHSY
jgi:hypothetical protein